MIVSIAENGELKLSFFEHCVEQKHYKPCERKKALSFVEPVLTRALDMHLEHTPQETKHVHYIAFADNELTEKRAAFCGRSCEWEVAPAPVGPPALEGAPPALAHPRPRCRVQARSSAPKCTAAVRNYPDFLMSSM